MTPLVKGLFLSGGLSHRMGTDKALLAYTGEPELRRWQAQFARLQLPFYWSQRPGQYPTDQFSDIARIYDERPDCGPMAGLLAAHEAFPDAAWLVLACDWPLLDADDLAGLLAARRPGTLATCFHVQNRREPLCTLYEPDFLRNMVLHFLKGETSLYRLLMRAEAVDVPVLEPARFLNANDRLSFDQASQNLAHRSDC